MIFKKKL